MKEKVLNFLSGILAQSSLILLSAYIIKCLIVGPQISDSIVVISLTSLFAFDKLLRTRQQPPINQAILKEIENLKGKIATLSIDRGIKRDEQQQKRFF